MLISKMASHYKMHIFKPYVLRKNELCIVLLVYSWEKLSLEVLPCIIKYLHLYKDVQEAIKSIELLALCYKLCC